MASIARALAVAVLSLVSAWPTSAWADAPDDLFRAAAEHYSRQEWQAACDEFGRLLETAPEHARATQARFYRGEALVQLGRYADAHAEFEKLRAGKPDESYQRQALFRAGEAAWLAGELGEARQTLREFDERYPDDELNAYGLTYLARIELDQSHPEVAEPLFARAVKRFHDGPLVDQCRLGLAESHEALGRVDDARREYETLVEAKSSLADHALLRLAALDNARGDYAAGLARLDRLSKELPKSPHLDRCQLGRGYALVKLGRFAEAEQVLSGLANHPTLSVDAHYWLGRSQLARKSWREAAATFTLAGATAADHRLGPALAYHAAQALIEDGQQAAALKTLDDALARWPTGDWADDCQLARLHLAAARTDHEAVVQLADEFASRFPTSHLRAQIDAAKGHALAALDKPAEAAAALERALAATPSPSKRDEGADADEPAQAAFQTSALQGLAICYAKLGRFVDAQAIVEALLAAPTADEAAYDTCYQVAEAAYAADKLQPAGSLFALLVKTDAPPDAVRRGLLGQAWCHFKSQDWARAAADCETLLTKFPDSPTAGEAALVRGRALEHLGQTDAALTLYRTAIERNTEEAPLAESIYRAARLCDTAGQRAEAIELYAKLAKEHAGFAELDAALYRWAWLLRESDADATQPLFERLRREFPNSPFVPDATLRLAERALAAARYDDARELLSEIVAPEAPETVRENALYLQGRVAAAAQDWPAVESSLARLIEGFPATQWALPAAYLRAEASYRRGDFAAAAKRFAELAAQTGAHDQPWSASAALRRAQSLAQLKQWHEALEAARAIATDFPQFDEQHEADYVIGRALAAQADFAGAREAYARVIDSPRGAQTETAAMARWMTGETFFHQQDFDAALAEYAKVDEYPFPRWQAAALLQAGKCHERLGQWEAAIAAYEQLLKSFPTSDLAVEASGRVAAARQHVAGRESTTK